MEKPQKEMSDSEFCRAEFQSFHSKEIFFQILPLVSVQKVWGSYKLEIPLALTLSTIIRSPVSC